MKAYGHAQDIDGVWRCWREMLSRHIKPTSITAGCMVEAIVNNGDTEGAYEIIHQMREAEADGGEDEGGAGEAAGGHGGAVELCGGGLAGQLRGPGCEAEAAGGEDEGGAGEAAGGHGGAVELRR